VILLRGRSLAFTANARIRGTPGSHMRISRTDPLL
jgi:hypothetical protein